MEEYVVRKYKEGDEREINYLFNEIFNEKRSLEEWSWKFKRNPLAEINLIAVAESQGKIVGQYASLPTLFKYKDKLLKASVVVDNLVHPEFRGGIKAIQWKMFEYDCKLSVEEGIDFGMGFPNREAYIIGKRVLKYKNIGQIRLLFKRLSWNPAIRKRFPWLPNSILRISQFISSIGFKLSIQFKHWNRSKGIRIRTIDSFDERFNSFWDKVKEQHNIIGVRDQRYLDWRFKKPGSNYQILTAEKGNELVGYIILSVKKDTGVNTGYIVDLLVNNTFKADYPLINRALLKLMSRKVDYALCWMLPDKEAYEALRSFGFIEKDDFPPVNIVHLIFNFEKVDEMFIKDPKNWYLTMADSDVF